jgi:hypothetical protein
VLGVAGRAASLLDLFFDHGDYGVIRHTTLTRAVVVHYVSKTQPALLHQLLPSCIRDEMGWKRLPKTQDERV